MKRLGTKVLSWGLTLVMLLGMVPGLTLPAEAATNLAGGFEGQDADVFSALGFDTTEIPEGYNEDSTENPYGRDIVPGNQVFELTTASAAGVATYGKDGNFELSGSDYSPSSGGAMPGNMHLFAAAAGDFDGDGLPGGIAYVGVADTSGDQELYLYFYDGEMGTYGAVKKICSAVSPEHTISGGDEDQEKFDFAWQNLLQITAGDYDGDGTAEIAVYVAENAAARVDIYKYQRTSQSGDKDWLQATNWSRVWSHALSADVVPNMVSLESGDFNRDGVDDLAISSGSLVFTANALTTSLGYMYMAKKDNLTVQYSRASTATVLWGAKSRMLQTHDGLDLNSGELGELVRVGFAYGDMDGDGVKDLIAAGQPINDAADNTTRTITAYTYVNDTGMTVSSSGAYKVIDGEFVTVEIDGQESTTNWKTNNGFDENYHSLPFMTANAAVMTPANSDYTYIYVDSCLYRNNEGQLQLFYSLDDESYSAEDTSARLDHAWIPDIQNTSSDSSSYGYCEYGAVSGDVDGSGADILSTAMMTPQTNSMSNLNYGVYTLQGSGDGVTMTNATLENWSSDAVVSVLVDVDLDTVIIEYTGVHYLTYSDPQVLAIIAAAPYYEDVDEVAEYDYAWQNTTSFSRIVGSGHSEFVTFDLEVGAWADSDWVIGGGKMVLEGAAMFTLEWEESTTKTTEYELTFETSQDEDAVAFFSIPTENYVYNIHVPNGKGGYDTTIETIQNTFTPCYQILNLDYYESIQGNYDELPQIAGVALTSSPGDPASYPSSTSGYNVIAQWNDDPAGVSFGNGSITQTITITEEQSESYNMGAAVDFKVGGGSGAQADIGQAKVEVSGGIQGSINPAGGWADVNFTGTSFSGTVTNMPLEFQDYGYYYTWKLFAYNYVFDNGASIPVVSYVVGDVSEPPKLPDDFQQDYDRTTSEENVLTWTYDGEATKFYLYKYFDFPVGGGLDLIAEIATNDSNYFEYKVDEEGKSYKEFSYTDANLTPYTEYQYAIQVERLNRVPPLSSPSALLTARTKASEGYPLLYINESDSINDGTLLVYPDKNSYLTVDVKGSQGENAANYYSIVQYQWQKMEKGAWVDMVNETGMTLTLANAGVDTAGSYRCRVNVQTRDTATYITAYTGTVVLTHAKRTSYIDETTLSVEDVAGGGIQLYAQVKNAHGDSAAIPSGTATFLFTNTATGASYTFFTELDATGTAAKIVEGTLPEGLYTVAVRYAGSYIFKACSADCMYLSQMGSGYTIDMPSTIIYGDGADLTFYKVSKSGGVTAGTEQQAHSATLYAADATSTVYRAYNKLWKDPLPSGQWVSGIEAGLTYRYMLQDGVWRYFTATQSGHAWLWEDYVMYGDSNPSSYLTYTNEGGKYALAADTPAGNYLVRMQGEESGPYAEALFTVDPRPITLQLPTQSGSEGTDAVQPKLGELAVAIGSWAPCDLKADGTLKDAIAGTVANTKYYNTAWKEFTYKTVDEVCGYYTIRCTDSLDNYDLKFKDGSLTILGATHDVTIAVRPFEGQEVGTLYAVSPDYAATRTAAGSADTLVQQHQTGTRLVFSAVPDAGYEIYDWYINGVAQGKKDASIAYVLLNENTTVEVQFAVKQNTLTFGTAGDAGGGTITCSDPTLTSGSVVIANANFQFTAVPKEGYHFKEWRYTEVGQGTKYDDEDFGKERSTFDLIMPSASCSVYAVFERDFYTFTYTDFSGNNGLTAWYENRVNDSPDAVAEKVYFTSGTQIKGDTVVTVETAKGCEWDSEYLYVSTGSQGTADYTAGTYTVAVTEDTAVTGYTNRDAYDLTLAFEVDTEMTLPEGTEIVYTLDDQEYRLSYDQAAPSVTIRDVPGGTAVNAQLSFPGYYDLKGWTAGSTQVTATADINRLAVLITSGGAVTKDQAYYYTDNGVSYYFTAPFTGTAEWTGTAVTVYASDTAFTIPALERAETITAHLTEKPVHIVTMKDISGSGAYSCELPDGAKSEEGSGGQTVVKVHDGDSLTVMVTPVQGKTVTYWSATPESTGTAVITRATSLKYAIPNIREDYGFEPIFSNTTYNTISWPTISESTVGLTLSPESGYLSSVVSGGTFKFTLSGGGLNLVERVYANGYEFTANGNEQGGTRYSYDASTGVYTIENINANQVITVTLKTIGVTVNGEDISAITGTGWAYNSQTQTLTLSRPNLTVSGENASSGLAPNLSIILNSSASSVTFSDLSVESASKQMLQIQGEDVTLTATGSSSVQYTGTNTTGSIVSATALAAAGNLTLRGNGSLELYLGSVYDGVTVAGTLTLSGNVNVSVSGGAGTAAFNVNQLVVGASSGSSAPALRVFAVRYSYGVQADTVTVNSGELAITVASHAVYAGLLQNNGGVMELSSSSTPFGYKGGQLPADVWTVNYATGALLRTEDSSGSHETLSLAGGTPHTLAASVSDTAGYKADWVCTILSDNTRYVRISPMQSSNTGVTMSVEIGGKTYSGPLVGGDTANLYYYVDLDDAESTEIQYVSKSDLETGYAQKQNWRIVASEVSGTLTLCGGSITWTKHEDTGAGGSSYYTGTVTPEPSTKYDYTLSGTATDVSGRSIIATQAAGSVDSLTLNNLYYGALSIGSAPLYLKGDNTLASETTALNVSSGAALNVYGDGSGSLTLVTTDDGTAVARADSINLYDIDALTVLGGSYYHPPIQTPTGSSGTAMKYYEGNVELPYGIGWRQELGTAAATAYVAETLNVNAGASYMKFGAAATNAAVSPTSLTYDLDDDKDQNRTIALTPPAVGGVIHTFNKAGGGNATTGYVAVLNAAGQETRLAAADYAYEADANQVQGKLTLKAAWLGSLATGSYTVRVYFYDENTTDATTYTMDIPLTVTQAAVSSGNLYISPSSATLKRGDSVTLTTTFTGTTPKVYDWQITGDGTLSENGNSAVLTVNGNAAIDNKIQVTVTSYADEDGNQPLGTATATITVTATAQNIDITCKNETPSGDGSYMLYQNTVDGSSKTWDFDAEVSLDEGTFEESKLTWSLWGAQRATTSVDPATGEVTIHPKEMGTAGQLKLTATYENVDGSTIAKTVILYLSTDAHVAYDNTEAVNGAITGATFDGSSISAGGAWIPAGSTVVVTATPDEEYMVKTWYVNGQSVMNNPLYTVDEESHTLTFTTTSMSHYVVTADYVNTNGFVITYSAGANGSLTAQSGGQTLASGDTVVKDSTVTFTATPDTHCAVARWIVDGEVYEQTEGVTYTSNSLTLSNIEADHTVTVEFVGAEIQISFAADAGGSVTLLVNSQKVENATSPYTVHAMDDVLVLASPAEGYLVDTWSANDGSGSYAPIPGSEGSASYSVEDITESFDVKVSFREAPSHTVTVTTNSYENGTGVVKSGAVTVPMSDSHTFTVKEHDTLTLLAVPDTGSYVYQWSVPEGVEYVKNGNSITLLDVKADLNDIEGGQYIGVTFRRNFYDVTLTTEGQGTLEARYDLTIGDDRFNDTITSSGSIRGGSKVDFTITPGTDYILSALTINGDKVTPTWDEQARHYTYTIDALTESVEVKAVFAETAELFTVTVPASFTHDTADDPAATVTEGSGETGYVPDGISEDVPAADLKPGTDAVEMANGGTARLTFAPEGGYTVDYNVLADEMNEVLAAAGSDAVYSLSMSGRACVVTITGVDADLDFTAMASPFVTTTVTNYCEVNIESVTDGTLEVYWNSVQLLDGAMVPEGSELTIVATPEEHFSVDELTADTTEGEQDLSDGSSGTMVTALIVTGDTDLDAAFARSEYEVTVNILGSGSGAVTIDGNDYTAGTYAMAVDSDLTIAAKAEIGSSVNDLGVPGGTDLDGDGVWDVTLTSDLTITAVFDAVSCAVTFNNPANGTLTVLDNNGNPVTNGQLVPVGTNLTILAVPNAHYRLESLTAGGADYTAALSGGVVSYMVNAEKRNHITCAFAVAEVPVSWNTTGGTVSVTMSDGTAVSNGQYVPVGTTLIVKTVPNTDYSLKTFTVTGTTVGSDGTCTVGAEPVVITAQFEYTGEIPTGPEGPEGPQGPAGPAGPAGPSGGSASISGEFTVAVTVIGSGTLQVTANGKTISNGDVVHAGTTLTITAEPAKGESLSALTVNGVAFTSGGTYEVYANTDIVADFSGGMGQPYYLDAGGSKVFIGFAYDADGDGTWDEGEYIAPEGVEVRFTPNHRTFTDVSGHWGEAYISFAADREILIGITDTLFNPDGSVTRAMVATVVGRLYERSFGIEITDTVHDFDDCDYIAYYGKYVDWAAENGIVEGYGNRRFGPNDPITREQMATILYRFAQMMEVVPAQTDAALAYSDSDTIAAWAREGALYCQTEGLIQGVGGSRFAPRETATRAQLATIIHNFIKAVLDEA